MQSVTRRLSLGCEVYYLDDHRKSGLGVAARQGTDKYIATLQASTAGLVSMSYLHKVSEKVVHSIGHCRLLTPLCLTDLPARRFLIQCKPERGGYISGIRLCLLQSPRSRKD